MRKTMLLAAMLAMVLAAAAPVFAQATIGDETQYVDCSQVQAAIAAQYGDANAAADDGSGAVASATAGVSQTQINACLGVLDFGDDGNGGSPAPEPPSGGESPAPEPAPEPSAAPSAAPAASGGTLPETGGAPLLALGAGAMLVAGGLVARRIVR